MGLKSSVVVKLQELSIGGEEKAPVRRVRLSEFFNRPIQTQEELDTALEPAFGIRFRSTSMKAQSSFWSESCSVLAMSLKTTSGLRTCS